MKITTNAIQSPPGTVITMGSSSAPKNQKKKHHWFRNILIFLVSLVALVGILYVAIQPIARWGTRKALNKLNGFEAGFGDCGVTLIPLHYRIEDLRIWKAGSEKAPILSVKHIEAGLNWRKLWHRQLLLSFWVDKADVRLVETPAEKNPAKEAKPLADQLNALLPLEIDRVQVRDTQAEYVFGNDRHIPSIRLTQIEATLENLVTRADLEEGTATAAIAATIQESGKITAFVTADPLEKQLTFAGEARLTNLHIATLAPVIEDKVDLKPTRGVLEVLARFEAKEGKLSGGVKPILKDAHVESTDDSFVGNIKAGLVDIALKIFSDRVPNRDAIATVIPIEGTILKPDLQLWPTILGVIRNAFVEGFSETYRSLPPPKEQGKPSLIQQIKSAVVKDSPPPKANPADNKKK